MLRKARAAGRRQIADRLVDRIRSVGYAEDSLKWTTDNAEETDSQSDSCSDSE